MSKSSGKRLAPAFREASQARGYCVAKSATLRAARLDPSATKGMSPQDDNQKKSKSKAAGGGARPKHASSAQATSKERGELAEMMFMVKASQKGLIVAKPYGDSRRYDFIVDVGTGLWRVQVRSSTALQYGSYMVNLQRHLNGRLVPYDPSEIDFVVAFVMPCDAWFVIPVEAIAGRKTAKMCLKGNPRSGTLGKYWEAWGLMTWRWPEVGGGERRSEVSS